MKLTRRSVLGSIGALGVTLTFAGKVTANAGEVRYLVAVDNPGVRRRIRNAGFDVVNELGGNVLVVQGEDDAVGDLRGIRGVDAADFDAAFEVDIPEALEVAELDETDDEDDDDHPGRGGGPPGRGNGRGDVESEEDQELDAHDADPFFLENQWDKFVTDALGAHAHATGVGSLIAVIDTGIDPDHPDLVDNINFDHIELFTSLDALDDHPFDVHGHGTNVAGIAAASGAVGVIGTAPDAEIASLKVFVFIIDEEGDVVVATTTGDILAAIDYAAEIGADAANLSLGTPPIPPQGNRGGIRVAYERVIQHATTQGTLVAASAGNSAANLQQGGFFTLPNSVAGAMSISATAPNDELTFYSNFGTNEIDTGAPGGGYEDLGKTLCAYEEWLDAGAPPLIGLDPRIPGDTGTLWLDEGGVPTTDPDAIDQRVDCTIPEWPVPFNFVFNAFIGGSWAWFAGTSMSAPQVAGLAALVRELDPGANAKQVEQAIKAGAEGTSGSSDPHFGAGRINALKTVEEFVD